MEKVSGHTRLWRRDAAYYFRAKVPVDLLKQYSPKLEIKFSLKTNDRTEAVRRVRAESVKLDEEFAALRNGKQAHPRHTVELSTAQVHAIGSTWLARWLESDEEARSRGLSDEAFENIENWTGQFSDEWRSALASGDTRETLKEAGELVNELIPAGSISAPESVRRVAFELLKQRVIYLETLQERQTGSFAPTIGHRSIPLQASSALVGTPSVQPDSPLLSEVFKRWAAERKPPAKTLAEWQAIFDRFQAMHGDLQAAQVVRSHVVKFKDALVAADKATNTVEKQVSALRSVFEWAVSNDLVQTNPARGVKIAAAKVTKEKRLPYDTEDLARIFSSTVYTEGDRPKAGGGEAAYWLPLLALYTGARVEELSQPHPEDVKEEDGVAILDISDRSGSQKLKNKHSRRRVPLHQELIRLGFLDYVARMRKAKKERLFPDLVPDKWGHCSGNFSKWWVDGHERSSELRTSGKCSTRSGTLSRKRVGHARFPRTFMMR